MQIDVSVIVPVYKIDELLLRRCLNSLKSQTNREAEFIVIDDGSPDNCGDICDEYSKLDNRINVIHTENLGVSHARNIGLERAKGKYIIFVDGDDFIEDDVCQKCVSVIEKNHKDVVFFKHDITTGGISNSLNSLAIHDLTQNELKQITASVISQDNPFDGVWAGPPWGKVFVKEIIDKYELRFVNGLKKSQDRVFVLDYLMHCNSGLIFDYCGYHYVTNNESVCHKYNGNIISILESAGDEIVNRVSGIDYLNEEIKNMYLCFLCEFILLDFFNKDNPDSFVYNKKRLKEIVAVDKYKIAVKKGNLNLISRKRRIIIIAVKLHMYSLAGVLSIILFR